MVCMHVKKLPIGKAAEDPLRQKDAHYGPDHRGDDPNPLPTMSIFNRMTTLIRQPKATSSYISGNWCRSLRHPVCFGFAAFMPLPGRGGLTAAQDLSGYM